MTFRVLQAAPAEDVWDALARHVRPGPADETPLTDALGRVLAADLRTEFDFPPFDRAVMDGYAVRIEDFARQPTELTDLGLVRAGAAERLAVTPGTCARINTGAPLPEGAEAVVMVEKSETLSNGRIRLDDTPRPEQHLERRASMMKRGDLLVRAGTRLGGGALAAAVAGGVRKAAVFRTPRVALLSTGDEVVSPDDTLDGAQIFDSNSVALADFIRRAGGEPTRLGRCPDEQRELRGMLRGGLEYDVLCVTGGMSKGTHDLVPDALEKLGVEWLVESLHMKPGKPMRIGQAPGGCWVLGLPGNPVSCSVCFLLFGRALLDGLSGLPVRRPAVLHGRLDADMPANGPRPLYQPAEWHAMANGVVGVSPLIWRGSGDPFGMAIANALIQRPANAPSAAHGEAVPFIVLDTPR